MNDIINKLMDKQINTLPDVHMDAEILRTIQEIESNYILLNKTKKSVELTKNLNEVLGYDFNYTPEKMSIGITFQELLFKAIAFQRNDPFEYIKERCVVIPKNEDVLDYLDGVKIMYRLSGDKDPDFTSNEVKLFDPKFKERNDKQFGDAIDKLLTNPKIKRYNRNDTYSIIKDHALLELKMYLPGTEEDRKNIYFNQLDDPKNKEAISILEDFTEELYGEKFNVNITESASVHRKLFSEFDGKTIFRTKQLIFTNGRNSSKSRNPVINVDHFHCYAGLFLNYNQYCDVIIKGSLK